MLPYTIYNKEYFIKKFVLTSLKESNSFHQTFPFTSLISTPCTLYCEHMSRQNMCSLTLQKFQLKKVNNSC